MNRPHIMLFLLFILHTFFLYTGCDKSGYGMAPPYEIDGIVYNGSPVKGTVHLETYKRSDHYAANIEPDGTFHISVWKEDPPYLLWADIEGGRTLFSFTLGEKNPTPEQIQKANESTTESPPVFYQTVNITPMTDMIIGLACLEDPEARYSLKQYPGFPTSAKVKEHQGHIQDLFKNVFTSFGHAKGFNLIHDDLEKESNVKKLIKCIVVEYSTIKQNDIESNIVSLLTTKNPGAIYEYNFNDKSVIKTTDPADVADIISSLFNMP